MKAKTTRQAHLRSEFRRFSSLTAALVVRELKGRYRRTILGPIWAVLQPLLYTLMFVFIRGIVGIPSEDVPYPIFVFAGLVPWTFFQRSILSSGQIVYDNAALVKKIAITREVFPTSAVLASLFDLLIAFCILGVFMAWFGVAVTWTVLWVPLLIVLLIAGALGLGLLMAAIGTFKRDVNFAMPFVMQFWLFATPIMYPVGQVPERWQLLYGFNPMVGIIEGFRRVTIKDLPPDFELLIPSILAIVIAWAIGLPLFRYVSQYFADVL